MTHRAAPFTPEVTARGPLDRLSFQQRRLVTPLRSSTRPGHRRTCTAGFGGTVIDESLAVPVGTRCGQGLHLPQHLASLASFPFLA
jgi:hypothetical protein